MMCSYCGEKIYIDEDYVVLRKFGEEVGENYKEYVHLSCYLENMSGKQETLEGAFDGFSKARWKRRKMSGG